MATLKRNNKGLVYRKEEKDFQNLIENRVKNNESNSTPYNASSPYRGNIKPRSASSNKTHSSKTKNSTKSKANKGPSNPLGYAYEKITGGNVEDYNLPAADEKGIVDKIGANIKGGLGTLGDYYKASQNERKANRRVKKIADKRSKKSNKTEAQIEKDLRNRFNLR